VKKSVEAGRQKVHPPVGREAGTTAREAEAGPTAWGGRGNEFIDGIFFFFFFLFFKSRRGRITEDVHPGCEEGDRDEALQAGRARRVPVVDVKARRL